jgi:hypothetical protein
MKRARKFLKILSLKMTNCKCGRKAFYGTTMKNPIYCSTCKPENTYNVVTPRCIHEGCMVFPSYGLPTSYQKKYCKLHKPEGYVNIQSKKCIVPGCGKHATNRKDKSASVLYCAKHSPPNYENVTVIRCKLCDTYATFTKIGQRKREYCASHCPPTGYESIHRKLPARHENDALSRCRSNKISKPRVKKPVDFIKIRYDSIHNIF